ncbi:MAG: hypothetical protein ACK44E_06470 [Anaerolineales bacterium]
MSVGIAVGKGDGVGSSPTGFVSLSVMVGGLKRGNVSGVLVGFSRIVSVFEGGRDSVGWFMGRFGRGSWQDSKIIEIVVVLSSLCIVFAFVYVGYTH